MSRRIDTIAAENPPLNLLHDTVYALERTLHSFSEEPIPGALLVTVLSFVEHLLLAEDIWYMSNPVLAAFVKMIPYLRIAIDLLALTIIINGALRLNARTVLVLFFVCAFMLSVAWNWIHMFTGVRMDKASQYPSLDVLLPLLTLAQFIHTLKYLVERSRLAARMRDSLDACQPPTMSQALLSRVTSLWQLPGKYTDCEQMYMVRFVAS